MNEPKDEDYCPICDIVETYENPSAMVIGGMALGIHAMVCRERSKDDQDLPFDLCDDHTQAFVRFMSGYTGSDVLKHLADVLGGKVEPE